MLGQLRSTLTSVIEPKVWHWFRILSLLWHLLYFEHNTTCVNQSIEKGKLFRLCTDWKLFPTLGRIFFILLILRDKNLFVFVLSRFCLTLFVVLSIFCVHFQKLWFMLFNWIFIYALLNKHMLCLNNLSLFQQKKIPEISKLPVCSLDKRYFLFYPRIKAIIVFITNAIAKNVTTFNMKKLISLIPTPTS